MNSAVANIANATERRPSHRPEAAFLLPPDPDRMNGPRAGASARNPAIATVILVGPPSTRMGGMASVVQQIQSLDFGQRYRSRLLPLTFSSGAAESLSGRLRRHVNQVRDLCAMIRRTGAAIVHLHTCSGFSFFRSVVDMLGAQHLGARVLLHIHGAAFDQFFAEAGWLGRRLISASLSRADCVIALSQRWRRTLSEMAPKARIAVVENAVALPTLEHTRLRPSGDGRCRFLLLARMDTWKGVDDLLTACARLRGHELAFELTLAGPPGSAGDAGQIERKIADRNLGSAVTYVGPVLGREKSRLLQSADVYVQPSHHEGMPISLLEALAYGLPVVATTVGAVPEVITDGCQGRLIPPKRPELLAAAMGELAGDAGQRERMSAAARQTAEQRFSLDRLKNDLLRVYDALRPGPHAPSP